MKKKPKNFLVLCSDEHAPGALGCYGHPVVQTPNLDRLASGGTRFTNAYTPSPICISARACLATGTHVFENQCWSSAQPYHGQMRSWMHDLRESGNTVSSIGKLHFRSDEEDHGFTEEILPMYLANDGKGWPQGLIRDPMPGFPEAQEMAKEIGPGETSYTHYDRDITRLTADWLNNINQDTPWTLFVSFISPHYPLTAPEEFYELYNEVELPSPVSNPAIDRHPVLREMRKFWDYDDHFDAVSRDIAVRSYYGLCSFLDHNIGTVLGALKQSGQADDTTVLYISDHGEMLGNHGFWAKSVMYEDSVGIPMILNGPGVPVSTNDTPVSLIDIAATAKHLAGIKTQKPENNWESTSLVTLANDPDQNRFVISEYHDGGSPTGIYMVRHDDWKYVYYAGGNPPQLFNLADDPNELDDLTNKPNASSVIECMHQLLLSVLDPEAVNNLAFEQQKKLIETYGGTEKILALPGFNHTPIGE